LVKQLRKKEGLDDIASTSGNPLPSNNPSQDLFPTNQSKGEWYFYNDNLKTQGLAQFKRNWGNRPNVDNWRRYADITQQMLAKTPDNTRDAVKNPNSLTTGIAPTYTS